MARRRAGAEGARTGAPARPVVPTGGAAQRHGVRQDEVLAVSAQDGRWLGVGTVPVAETGSG
eukprot:scaffold5929_cov120-Isochrysis_galbana.AAC.4